MKEMGKRLKGLRESMGLSQMKMAEILGLKQPSINRYEQGTATPTVENLRKYADYFDVSMDWLLSKESYNLNKTFKASARFFRISTLSLLSILNRKCELI